MAIALKPTTAKEYSWLTRNARARQQRTMAEFAEQEIRIPDEPGLPRYRIDSQPSIRHWFEAVDSGRYERHWGTGCTQSGKTLSCVVIPAMYHLFEIGETVIVGLPSMEMAGDKWREDFEPAIRASRYRDLLPRVGAGSRGGKVEAIKFRNGATLKFMSAGGRDEKRSGFTARVVVLTELDKFDTSGGTSRETDKVSQIIARTDRYGSRRRIYGECTVSITRGRIWQEYLNGTQTAIVLQCHACGNWVAPDREHFVGWEKARTVIEAGENASFCCPKCGAAWSDEHREIANFNSRTITRTDKTFFDAEGEEHFVMQTIGADGAVGGEPPATDSFSFRWSAVNNLFWSSADIGKRMWRLARRTDEQAAEREACQFVFCEPYEPPAIDLTPLSAKAIERRTADLQRGIVPADADFLIVTVDLGKRVAHWIAQAWLNCGRSHVVDYGRFDVPSDDLGVEAATLIALRDFRDETALKGWFREGDSPLAPHLAWIDSGYPESQKAVYQFCLESGERFRPVKGQGAAQRTKYHHPRKTGDNIKFIGEEYCFSWQAEHGLFLVLINSDHWKSFAHERLGSSPDAATALTLFRSADANEHVSISKHFTAEKKTEEFIPGKGLSVKWIPERRANHWLDCLYMNCAAAHFCGVRVIPSAAAPDRPAAKRKIKGLKSLYRK